MCNAIAPPRIITICILCELIYGHFRNANAKINSIFIENTQPLGTIDPKTQRKLKTTKQTTRKNFSESNMRSHILSVKCWNDQPWSMLLGAIKISSTCSWTFNHNVLVYWTCNPFQRQCPLKLLEIVFLNWTYKETTVVLMFSLIRSDGGQFCATSTIAEMKLFTPPRSDCRQFFSLKVFVKLTLLRTIVLLGLAFFRFFLFLFSLIYKTWMFLLILKLILHHRTESAWAMP